jgi:NAD(P)H-flavin reductase/NADPH-dependent glutamate synthase beta subunit-like oxidoreductase
MIKFSSFIDYDFEKLDDEFQSFLLKKEKTLYEIFIKNRQNNSKLDSQDLIDLSLILEEFLTNFFSIENQILKHKNLAEKHKKIYEIKRNFIHRFAIQKYDISILDSKNEILAEFANLTKLNLNNYESIDEYYIRKIQEYKDYGQIPEVFIKYAALRIYLRIRSNLFSNPEKQDFENLLSSNIDKEKPNIQNPLQEANYCIKCHHNMRDSCSKGLFKNNIFQTNPLGNELKGCPLDIKISEMNELFANGNIISSLAVIALDNPMVALTGRRICNDCSKACIFQKQKPVDIPSIESEILSNVLELDYGFEIYYLLTQWNPLATENYNLKQQHSNILVVGGGPAGIALSHYLLKAGCRVVMIDGLKIERLPEGFVAKSFKNYSVIKELYKKISPQGLGGVSEYGITDRWNKENLIVARLILERSDRFNLYGGIKFGSNVTFEDAISIGFDHVALCCGSGYPNIPLLDNIDSANIRLASDFLMSIGSQSLLQDDTNANFFIDLPAFVVGGGLTAVDAADQLKIYYPKLVRRISAKDHKDNKYSEYEKNQIVKFKRIKSLLDLEDEQAKLESRTPDYTRIIQDLGGINIIYRKNLNASPAYRINHEELDLCLREGINILENAEITSIQKDQNNNVSGIEIILDGAKKNLDAKTILFAIGTRPLDRTEFVKQDSYKLSIFGDMDKEYSGSVVKAIASAKDGWKNIISKTVSCNNQIQDLDNIFSNKVEDVIHLSSDIIEIKVRNKFLVKNFSPGQFFKIQNYHNLESGEKSFEPLAITGAYLDHDNNVISMIIQNVGESSAKSFSLKKGDSISISGPLGTPSEILKNSSVLLIGGGVGTAALFEYAKRLKENGCEVTFLAGYRKKSHIIYPEIIRKYSSRAIFVCDEKCDPNVAIHGNILDGLNLVDLSKIDSIFVVGSSRLMEVVANFLSEENTPKYASINAPMQCMMGGVCGQCIMPIKDEDGTEKMIFICKEQDQILSPHLIKSLQIRLCQNSILEKF